MLHMRRDAAANGKQGRLNFESSLNSVHRGRCGFAAARCFATYQASRRRSRPETETGIAPSRRETT